MQKINHRPIDEMERTLRDGNRHACRSSSRAGAFVGKLLTYKYNLTSMISLSSQQLIEYQRMEFQIDST